MNVCLCCLLAGCLPAVCLLAVCLLTVFIAESASHSWWASLFVACVAIDLLCFYSLGQINPTFPPPESHSKYLCELRSCVNSPRLFVNLVYIKGSADSVFICQLWFLTSKELILTSRRLKSLLILSKQLAICKINNKIPTSKLTF